MALTECDRAIFLHVGITLYCSLMIASLFKNAMQPDTRAMHSCTHAAHEAHASHAGPGVPMRTLKIHQPPAYRECPMMTGLAVWCLMFESQWKTGGCCRSGFVKSAKQYTSQKL